MQNFYEDEVPYLESPHLHLRVEISSCTPLIRRDSKLRVMSFLFDEIKLAPLQGLRSDPAPISTGTVALYL